MFNNRKTNLAEIEAKQIVCPICGAKSGDWCRSTDIRDDNPAFGYVHIGRKIAAKNA